MSGETEDNVSGWTVDTLHSHLSRLLNDLDLRFQAQLDAHGVRLDDMRLMLNERYDTQTKALDAAFLAQQTAMQTALTAADTAVRAALDSAEKAVVKAEMAAEKRFESVNEFRGQLTDQAATFMPRAEAEQRIAVNAEKIDGLTARFERTEGRGVGLNAGWIYLLGALAAIGTIVSLYIAFRTGG